MPVYARREIVNPEQIGVYHCISRCVRRAFLCGFDEYSGKDFEHRKPWIRDRLEFLASVFAVEVCGYSVMSNHYHVVLRIRPDIATTWSDDEVAIRWLRLHPIEHDQSGKPIENETLAVAMIKSDPERIRKCRLQLCSVSWFMRELNEPIARRANREDHVSGRFWQGRFRSQALLDEAAMLACSVYVDLNPVRAGIAATPEESQFTSAYDRISALTNEMREIAASDAAECLESAVVSTRVPVVAAIPEQSKPADAWLCNLTLEEGPERSTEQVNVLATPKPEEQIGALTDERKHASSDERKPEVKSIAPSVKTRVRALPSRASDRGFLPISLTKYLKLLDWTGRELRVGKRGSTPRDLSPILERLGINVELWLETVRHFGRWFKRAAGRGVSLAEYTELTGKRWHHGQVVAKVAFT